MTNIKRRMTPQPLKIRADVELTCFAYDGVERIRDAMRAAQVGMERGMAVQLSEKRGVDSLSLSGFLAAEGPTQLPLCVFFLLCDQVQ